MAVMLEWVWQGCLSGGGRADCGEGGESVEWEWGVCVSGCGSDA